jgi:hypothetical protein
MPELINKGDYVLATKYEDGDPGDNWAVGYYDRMHDFGKPPHQDVRYFVVDGEGKQFRGGIGFRRVGKINTEYGAWLLSVAKELEKAPPGSVNLWGMLGRWATCSEDDE